MDYWRSAARISCLDTVRNERVREIMGIDWNIVDDIRNEQLLWYGHVKRMEEKHLPTQLLEWQVEGRRRKRRRRMTWKGDNHEGNVREETSWRRLDV
jgi:hypothetical protein